MCVRAFACVFVCVLPLVQRHNVPDVPEDDLFLVQDVDGDVSAGLQILKLVRSEHLHLLHKLLLSVNQALDQLAGD